MVSSLRILIVAKGDPGSGNLSSAARIRRAVAMSEKGITCEFLALDRRSEAELLEGVISRNPDVVLAIHLRRCSFLSKLPTSIPLLLICGGTDVNEDVANSERLQAMEAVVRRSRAVVFFSTAMLLQFRAAFPQFVDCCRFWTIPQAVELTMEISEKDVRPQLGLDPGEKFFIVVGRLRRVKDPGFVIRPFHEWSKGRTADNFVLIFLGGLEKCKDEGCMEVVEEIQRCSPAVRHVNTLSPEDCHRAMKSAVALINCSRSEGQAGAILEAMALGTPVLARDIPGNRDIVTHNETGLLFRDAETFREGLTRLADQTEFRQKLKAAAHSIIVERHSPLQEAKSYREAIFTIMT